MTRVPDPAHPCVAVSILYLQTGASLSCRPWNNLQGWPTLGWPGRANFGPTLGQVGADFGMSLTLGRLCANSGPTWADFELTLDRIWADFGPTFAQTGDLPALD